MKIYEAKENAALDNQQPLQKIDVAFINEKKRPAASTTDIPQNELLLIEEHDSNDKDFIHHWATPPSIFTELDNHRQRNYGEIDHVEEKVFDDNVESQQFYHNRPVGWYMIFRSGLKPFGVKRWPVVTTYILLTMMFLILSGELLLSQQISNEFIELDPFNIMIGPSIQILVQVGARFPPCMHATLAMPPDERYICLNTTHLAAPDGANTEHTAKLPPTTTALELLHPIVDIADLAIRNTSCSLQDICGMRGFADTMVPDQSFRFFTPLFVHVGVIHYLINVFLHWFFAMNLERVMNPIRFAGVYLLSGLFGNVFGASLSSNVHPTMGSGPSLFGLFGCSFIDLILMWRIIGQPSRHFIKIIVIVASSFILGLLPGVDCLALVGGLIGGLLIGVVAMPAMYYSKKYQVTVWICRLVSVVVYMVLMALLVHNFYQ